MTATQPASEQTVAGIIHQCEVLTVTGEHVTSGLGVLIARPDGREARVTDLSAPGTLLNLHLGKGMRRFLLRVDGASLQPAELLVTEWQGGRRRVCRFRLP